MLYAILSYCALEGTEYTMKVSDIANDIPTSKWKYIYIGIGAGVGFGTFCIIIVVVVLLCKLRSMPTDRKGINLCAS